MKPKKIPYSKLVVFHFLKFSKKFPKNLLLVGPGKEKDDIHSTYYKQFEESFDETTKFDINNLYHINFLENEDNSVPVNLTDINRIDIENEDTFYRVPHLAHDLD